MGIQVLSFLLLLQSLLSCQQAHDNPLSTTFGSDVPSVGPKCSANTLATTANVVLTSHDEGETWQDFSAGLPVGKQVDCFLTYKSEAILGTADGIYRSAATLASPGWAKDFLLYEQINGLYAGRAGLYAYSARNGFFQNIALGVWTKTFSMLENESFRTMMEAADGTLFIGTDNGIFKSTDNGKTWKHVYEQGWVIKMVESNGVLLCTNQQGILRSSDGGEHWDLVISEGGVGIAVEAIDGGFAAITYNTSSETRRIRISTDAGKTWQAIDSDLPPHANIASIKQVGQNFFCGHPVGIYRSSDRGKTWKLILPSIGNKVFNLSVCGKVIYAMPKDAGC